MKRIKRSLFAMSLLVGASWAITPAFAQVDQTGPRNVAVMERPRPDYDAMGAHIGAFDIYPAITFTGESTDNVFATHANKKSDLIFTVAPYISAQTTWSRHELRVAAGLSDVRHQDATQDDHTDGFVTGDARIDIYHNSSFSFGGGYQDAHEPRTAASSASIAPELVHYTVGSGYALGATTLDRFRISVRGDYADLNYDNIPGFPQDFRDHTETTGAVRLEYALSPDTALVGQVSANKHDYNSNLSSTGQEYLVGVSTDITHLIRGEIDLGYTTQDYDIASTGRISGAAAHAQLQWFPSEATTLTLSADRRVEDTGVVGSGGALVSTVGVQVDHELLRNVILTGGVDGGKSEYRGIARTDDWVDANVGATYMMNRHVGVSAGYYYTNYSSDEAGAPEFKVSRFAVSLKLKL